MNRLQYWLNAQTQYKIHSPFVFEMYRKVLFSSLGKEQKKRVAKRSLSRHDRIFHELVFKMTDYYGLEMVAYEADYAKLEGSKVGTVLVVRRPHLSSESESEWERMKKHGQYTISIDLYDAGLLIRNNKLHPQEFILR